MKPIPPFSDAYKANEHDAKHFGEPKPTPSAAEKLIEKPVEETETWQTFADYFGKHEGFKPHPRDSRAKELYNYYCVGLFDASRHSGQAVDEQQTFKDSGYRGGKWKPEWQAVDRQGDEK